MKLHFEGEDLTERQECSALTCNLEGLALNWAIAKKQDPRDNAEKNFEILLNRFGSEVQGHQAMMRFDKQRQRKDETIGMFLDNLEMLRRLCQPDESNSRMNLAVASHFIDDKKKDELRTTLATHYPPLLVWTPPRGANGDARFILCGKDSHRGTGKRNLSKLETESEATSRMPTEWKRPSRPFHLSQQSKALASPDQGRCGSKMPKKDRVFLCRTR